MKFGIFYEHQLPRPWTATSEYELFQNSLAQVELADRLGYDYHVGGRASLPRGILSFFRAGGVSRGGQPAHHSGSVSGMALSN